MSLIDKKAKDVALDQLLSRNEDPAGDPDIMTVPIVQGRGRIPPVTPVFPTPPYTRRPRPVPSPKPSK